MSDSNDKSNRGGRPMTDEGYDHFLMTLMKHIMRENPKASEAATVKLYLAAVENHDDPGLKDYMERSAGREILREIGYETPKPH